MSFDKTKPAGSTPLKTADDQIRANFEAIETALDADHDFTTGGTQTGKHDKVTFHTPLTTKPTLATSEGGMYTKDVSAKAELHFEDEDGDEVQITSGGLIHAVSAAVPAKLRVSRISFDGKDGANHDTVVTSLWNGDSRESHHTLYTATSYTFQTTGSALAVLAMNICGLSTQSGYEDVLLKWSLSGGDIIITFYLKGTTAAQALGDILDLNTKYMEIEITYLTDA